MGTGRSGTDAQGPGPPLEAIEPARWLDDHGDVLYGFALARVGRPEVAEDLVQETLLAALGARGRFEGRSAVGTWLVSILRRKIADHYRTTASNLPGDQPDAEDETERPPVRERFFNDQGHWRRHPAAWSTSADPIERGEFFMIFERCMTELPGSLAAAFAARSVEERSPQDICRELGISRANLRIRLHRARLLLRDCLERRWFDTRPSVGTNPS